MLFRMALDSSSVVLPQAQWSVLSGSRGLEALVALEVGSTQGIAECPRDGGKMFRTLALDSSSVVRLPWSALSGSRGLEAMWSP